MSSFISEGTVCGASLSLAVGTIGAGVLALPSAFADAGVVVALGTLIVVAVFTIKSIRYLTVCMERLSLFSYESLSRELLGPSFEQVVRVMLILYNFGAAVGFVVAVGELLEPFHDNLMSIFPVLTSPTHVMVAFWACVMLPLAFVRRISSLNVFSLFAVCATNFIALAVVYRFFVPFVDDDDGSTLAQVVNSTGVMNTSAPHSHHIHPTRAPRQGISVPLPTFRNETISTVASTIIVHLASWDFIALLSMPIIMFSFDCQALSFQIYHSLADPNLANMTKVATISTVICCVIYASVGVFGYLSHGQFVRENILNNYDPKKDSLFALTYALYSVPINIAYAVILFPVRDAIFNYLYGVSAFNEDEGVTDRQFNVTSFLLSLGTILCAVATPGIVSIFAVLGGLCSSTLCFIYPAAFRIRLHQLGLEKGTPSEVQRMWGMLAFGIFGAAFGTAIGLAKLFGWA